MTNKTKKNLRLTKYRSYGLIIIVGNDAGNWQQIIIKIGGVFWLTFEKLVNTQTPFVQWIKTIKKDVDQPKGGRFYVDKKKSIIIIINKIISLIQNQVAREERPSGKA